MINTTMPANKLLIKHPIVSEKAVSLSNNGQYVFLIDRRANRSEIQKLVEEIYKVKVVGVNIVRIKNKRRDIKKAVVTLKAGDKINIES